MRRIKSQIWKFFILIAALAIAGCSEESKSVPPAPEKPAVELELMALDSYSATIQIRTRNVETLGAWICIEAEESLPSVEEILNNGTSFDIHTTPLVELESLTPEQEYIFVAAVASGELMASTQLEFTTEALQFDENHALIVFMQGGDNGLAEYMDVNLQNIITAYYELPEGTPLVIFYDRGNYTRLTELYMSDGMVKQRLIKEYNKTLSSVDPEFMRGVFELIEQEIEAESYGMILSSHGGGWVPAEIYKSYLNYDWTGSTTATHQAKPLFYGQDSSEYMEIPTLAEVISTFHYDYLIFDACFMASVEGLYDLRNNADYIIASSAEVLGYGFPYAEMIPMLYRPDHGLEEVCKAYMELFKSSSGTISLIDCAQYDALAEAMARVVESSDGTIDASQIQGYEGYPIHLYYDLEQHVEQMTDNETLREEFRTALKRAVLYTDHTPTFFSALYGEKTLDLPRSCGLTCHVEREEFPATHEAYLETAWAKRIGAK